MFSKMGISVSLQKIPSCHASPNYRIKWVFLFWSINQCNRIHFCRIRIWIQGKILYLWRVCALFLVFEFLSTFAICCLTSFCLIMSSLNFLISYLFFLTFSLTSKSFKNYGIGFVESKTIISLYFREFGSEFINLSFLYLILQASIFET